MAMTVPTLESLTQSLTLSLTQETHVSAPLDITFAALLEEIGPSNQTPYGERLPMKIEAWPGGRWFRDLGNDDGHLWGHVQAIKRPTLLEICGPLFFSYPVVSNLQYRLTEAPGGTLITFRHTALGFLQEDHRTGLSQGWTPLLDRTRRRAEATPPIHSTRRS